MGNLQATVNDTTLRSPTHPVRVRSRALTTVALRLLIGLVCALVHLWLVLHALDSYPIPRPLGGSSARIAVELAVAVAFAAVAALAFPSARRLKLLRRALRSRARAHLARAWLRSPASAVLRTIASGGCVFAVMYAAHAIVRNNAVLHANLARYAERSFDPFTSEVMIAAHVAVVNMQWTLLLLAQGVFPDKLQVQLVFRRLPPRLRKRMRSLRIGRGNMRAAPTIREGRIAPRWSRWTGWLLAACGSWLVWSFDKDNSLSASAIQLVGVLIALTGAYLAWRARQLDALRQANLLFKHPSPKVLYLREFDSDSSATSVLSVVWQPVRLLVTGISVEEQLCGALRPIGPVVAIGRPDRRLPSPGALPTYVPQTNWKTVVQEHMQSSKLLVIRAGFGRGLRWELTQAARLVEPARVVLVILGMSQWKYDTFRAIAKRSLCVKLPRDDRSAFSRVHALVRFTDNWTPVLVPIRWVPLRSPGLRLRQAGFEYALFSTFNALGARWSEPRLSRGKLALLCLLGLVWLLKIRYALSLSAG
jgi:hypothetical protein